MIKLGNLARLSWLSYEIKLKWHGKYITMQLFGAVFAVILT